MEERRKEGRKEGRKAGRKEGRTRRVFGTLESSKQRKHEGEGRKGR